MKTPESQLDYEHSIFRIKEILYKLFPLATLPFNADWLNKKIPKKTKNEFYIHGEYKIIYSGKKSILSNGSEFHHYKIKGDIKKAQDKLEIVVNEVYRNSQALAYKWAEAKGENFKWFEFQSEAELAIAEELTKRNILFFCNAKCLISNTFNTSEKMIPDFLVIYQGKSRILEIDGVEYHKNHFTDYRRDRLFEGHGLRITRYTYDECIADSKRVIDEFLELFEDGINYFNQLIRMFHSNEPSKYS